jgi:hypothetical protein
MIIQGVCENYKDVVRSSLLDFYFIWALWQIKIEKQLTLIWGELI